MDPVEVGGGEGDGISISKGLNRPNNDPLPDRPNLNEKMSGPRSVGPIPISDVVWGSAATGDVNPEPSDKEGRPLCIGRGNVTVLNSWDVFGV